MTKSNVMIVSQQPLQVVSQYSQMEASFLPNGYVSELRNSLVSVGMLESTADQFL